MEKPADAFCNRSSTATETRCEMVSLWLRNSPRVAVTVVSISERKLVMLAAICGATIPEISPRSEFIAPSKS